jgi:hypothetical protein
MFFDGMTVTPVVCVVRQRAWSPPETGVVVMHFMAGDCQVTGQGAVTAHRRARFRLRH